MNRVLARQLSRLGLTPDEPPSDAAAWTSLLERVGAHYDGTDRRRYLLQRAIEISSREMRDINENIRQLASHEMERQQQLAQHSFVELPVAAWLEDFRAVADRLESLRASGVDDLADHLDSHPETLRDLVGRAVVVDCNPAATELVGADRDAQLGQVDAAVLSDESLASWRVQFEAMWEGRGTASVEFVGQRTNGDPFHGMLHWSVAVIDGEYDFSRVMVVIVDITDRIEAEAQTRQMVVAKDEFLASVSHELRTPLTSVMGYAQVLLDDDLDPQEQAAMLRTIAEEAADLSNIVDDLLAGARAELGRLHVDKVPVNLADVVDGSLRSLPKVTRLGDSIEGVEVVGDPGRIRQVLRNLLTNSDRYGGPDVVVRTVLTGESVEIVVADSGPIIPAAVDGRVFQRYYREEGERRPTGSVGLGLAIARELALLMGGDLTYRHDGTWSEFVFALPRVRGLRAVS